MDQVKSGKRKRRKPDRAPLNSQPKPKPSLGACPVHAAPSFKKIRTHSLSRPGPSVLNQKPVIASFSLIPLLLSRAIVPRPTLVLSKCPSLLLLFLSFQPSLPSLLHLICHVGSTSPQSSFPPSTLHLLRPF